METLKKKELKKEALILKKMYEEHGRVTKSMQAKLAAKGYELCDLGTSKKCYTYSGKIGEHIRVRDDQRYFGIGIYNRSVRPKGCAFSVNIYSAWIKRIES